MASPGSGAKDRNSRSNQAASRDRISKGTAGNGGGGGGRAKNNFAGYRGPAGTSNPDTASAGVSTGPLRNSGTVSTGQTTRWGAPVVVDPKYGVKVALPATAVPGKPARAWSAWKGQMDTYNAAVQKWNASAQKPSIANLINNLEVMGVSMQAPDLNRPKTYTGGDYHLGINPAAAIGSFAGLAMPGLGAPASSVLGAAYTLAGGKNLMLSGPSVPAGWDKKGASPAVTSSGAAGATGPAAARQRQRATSMLGGDRRGTPGTLLGYA